MNTIQSVVAHQKNKFKTKVSCKSLFSGACPILTWEITDVLQVAKLTKQLLKQPNLSTFHLVLTRNQIQVFNYQRKAVLLEMKQNNTAMCQCYEGM